MTLFSLLPCLFYFLCIFCSAFTFSFFIWHLFSSYIKAECKRKKLCCEYVYICRVKFVFILPVFLIKRVVCWALEIFCLGI